MRRFILALVLLPAPVVADVVQPPAYRHCRTDDRVLAAARAGHDGFRRLDRLPPADEYLTVFRAIDRCPVPAIVRYAIGASTR